MADDLKSEPIDDPTPLAAEAGLFALGDTPAGAMDAIYLGTAQALALAAQNAVALQHQTTVTAQAATTQGVALLYSLSFDGASAPLK
jgi:killing trait domain-containing protein